MNCPHCQRALPDPNVATCPFCGMPVHAAAGQDPYTGPMVVQGAPAGDPSLPAWNQPPGGEAARPDWNQPIPEQPVQMPPTPPPPPTPQPPAYTPPAFTPPAYNQPPAPGYGQPQTPAPTYGQPQTPGYGQPPQATYGAPGAQPNYQAGYPQTPGQPWTGQVQPQQPQPKKSRAGCVIGCLVALVLVIGLVAGSAFLFKDRLGQITFGGATLGGGSTVAGGGSIIFQDSLDGTTDTSTKDQWTSDSSCSFGAGGYHISAGFICYAPTDTVSDAITTVSVQQISGPLTYAYGLVFRRPSAGNYYEFEVDSNGKWIFDKTVNGKTTTIDNFTANAAIKKGLNQVNTLTVKAQGSHFIFSVNGTQVGTADDTTFTSGKTGLAGNDGIEVVFTQFVIAHVK